jgi:hypothetical protein
MATNLFTSAKTLTAKAPKAKKAEAPAIEIEGLENYAALDALEKAVKTLKETARVSVTDAAKDIFVNTGTKINAKPENFKAKEGNATASIQLKQRSSASGLTDIEIALLDKADIPTQVVEDRPETYIFNPAHLEWLAKNGAAVSKALIKLGAPDDVIQLQESTKKTVTTAESLDVLFAKPAKTINELIAIVGSIAIRPSFEDQDKAFDLVKKLAAKVEA